MKITLTNKTADTRVIFLTKKEIKQHKGLKDLGKGFDFAVIDGMVYASSGGVKTKDDWRELGYNLIQYLNGLNFKKVSIRVETKQVSLVEGLILGDYTFTTYKSKPEKNKLNSIYLPTKRASKKDLTNAITRAEAQCLVRDMVNGTPEDMNSTTIWKAVKKHFEGTDVAVTLIPEHDLATYGMNGHLAVNRASRHPAMTIRLDYTPKNYDKHVVLVGKGLTYDSGGLDIKTGGYMVDMKSDKAGAVTVYGIMGGIAKMGSKNRVTGYMALAENMIDGSAYKADDVLTMMNGKTVHVKNTDAEGRIVLFDNLCLAEHEHPKFNEIYTFATLTGAAVYQFGAEACGMVGFNDKLKKKIRKVGDVEGEVFCNAEFHKFMLNGVDDKVADISNTGTSNQGCQKAGLFLTKALTKKGKKKYLHLDIAGAGWAESDWGTNKAGGTGFAVRTFLNYLKT